MSSASTVNLSAIKALSFDLDDTLWSIMPIIGNAERASREWLLEHYPNTSRFFDERSVLDLREEVYADYPDQHYDLSFLRKECIGRILESADYNRDGVEGAFAAFKYARDTIELCDDVMPFFDRLKDHVPVIALTNGNASVERTPLKDRFDTYLTAAIVRAPKPEPAMFVEALKTHSLEPHEMLHIGDHLDADVAGAAALGIPTVWINRFSHEWAAESPRPDFVINTLNQLAGILDAHTDLMDTEESNF